MSIENKVSNRKISAKNKIYYFIFCRNFNAYDYNYYYEQLKEMIIYESMFYKNIVHLTRANYPGCKHYFSREIIRDFYVIFYGHNTQRLILFYSFVNLANNKLNQQNPYL
jgi:hypothetical protein